MRTLINSLALLFLLSVIPEHVRTWQTEINDEVAQDTGGIIAKTKRSIEGHRNSIHIGGYGIGMDMGGIGRSVANSQSRKFYGNLASGLTEKVGGSIASGVAGTVADNMAGRAAAIAHDGMTIGQAGIVDSGKAKSPHRIIDDSRASELFRIVDNSKASGALGIVDSSRASKALGTVDDSKANGAYGVKLGNILLHSKMGNLGSESVRGSVTKNVGGSMASGLAEKVGGSIASGVAGTVADNMAGGAAAIAHDGMTIGQAGIVDSGKASSPLRLIDGSMAGGLFGIVDNSKASGALGIVDSSRASKPLGTVDDSKANGAYGVKLGNIFLHSKMGNLGSESVRGSVAKNVGGSMASGLAGKVDGSSGVARIVADNVTGEAAGTAHDSMTISQAGIVDGGKASSALGIIDGSRASGLFRIVDNSQASRALGIVDSSKGSKALGTVDDSKANDAYGVKLENMLLHSKMGNLGSKSVRGSVAKNVVGSMARGAAGIVDDSMASIKVRLVDNSKTNGAFIKVDGNKASVYDANLGNFLLHSKISNLELESDRGSVGINRGLKIEPIVVRGAIDESGYISARNKGASSGNVKNGFSSLGDAPNNYKMTSGGLGLLGSNIANIRSRGNLEEYLSRNNINKSGSKSVSGGEGSVGLKSAANSAFERGHSVLFGGRYPSNIKNQATGFENYMKSRVIGGETKDAQGIIMRSDYIPGKVVTPFRMNFLGQIIPHREMKEAASYRKKMNGVSSAISGNSGGSQAEFRRDSGKLALNPERASFPHEQSALIDEKEDNAEKFIGKNSINVQDKKPNFKTAANVEVESTTNEALGTNERDAITNETLKADSGDTTTNEALKTEKRDSTTNETESLGAKQVN